MSRLLSKGGQKRSEKKIKKNSSTQLERVVDEKLGVLGCRFILKLNPVDAGVLIEASDGRVTLVLSSLEQKAEPSAAILAVGLWSNRKG